MLALGLLTTIGCGTVAFAPHPVLGRSFMASTKTSSTASQPTLGVLYSQPTSQGTTNSDSPTNDDNDDTAGLDLDLGEMFDIFDAADKGVDFDRAIKNVKKDQ